MAQAKKVKNYTPRQVDNRINKAFEKCQEMGLSDGISYHEIARLSGLNPQTVFAIEKTLLAKMRRSKKALKALHEFYYL
ncbi:MAG: hypothetical protein V3R25_09280 [Nitrosomonadaceae bacterium]